MISSNGLSVLSVPGAAEGRERTDRLIWKKSAADSSTFSLGQACYFVKQIWSRQNRQQKSFSVIKIGLNCNWEHQLLLGNLQRKIEHRECWTDYFPYLFPSVIYESTFLPEFSSSHCLHFTNISQMGQCTDCPGNLLGRQLQTINLVYSKIIHK